MARQGAARGTLAASMIPDYSFVVPVYNECESLEELHRRLDAVMDQLDGPAEVVLVDDGAPTAASS